MVTKVSKKLNFISISIAWAVHLAFYTIWDADWGGGRAASGGGVMIFLPL